MNKTNKVLLHIGMIAAISGMSHCYAAEDAPKDGYIDGSKCSKYRSKFSNELLLAGPLPKDAKVDRREFFGSIKVKLPGCDTFEMRSPADNLLKLSPEMQGEFLNKYTNELLPLLFQKLDESNQRKFAEKHAQELQDLRVEHEHTASAWRLSRVAERVFADNDITVVNDHEVRLSKPLGADITPDLCRAIACYKITDRGSMRNIFGQDTMGGIRSAQTRNRAIMSLSNMIQVIKNS